jgi:hypothetical protein
MKRTWLTKQEAIELSTEHQYLLGQIFITDGAAETVECVAVAPHDELSRAYFLSHYLENRKLQEALSFYGQPYYDVVLVMRCEKAGNSSSYYLKSLLAFFAENIGSPRKLNSYSALYSSL